LATRFRKVRRLRGSRTHGWGTSGQHRGSGMRGGFGQAGRFRHKKSRVIRNKEFIGKIGFVSVAQKRRSGEVVNLWQLSEMVEKLMSEKKAQIQDQRVVIDLGQLGIRKLLGTGSVSKPLLVKVDRCSESATQKIKDAGGEVLLSVRAK